MPEEKPRTAPARRPENLPPRAWRLLLHAVSVGDEIHAWEPWMEGRARMPALEDALAAAEHLRERGLCEEGSGPAWLRPTEAGRRYVAEHLERYRTVYPQVTAATEKVTSQRQE